jgi:PKHD-type hydroxylase
VALLNDPSEYEGGMFIIHNSMPLQLTQGTVIAFPSLTTHRVDPVTKGDRYSAACWIRGPK